MDPIQILFAAGTSLCDILLAVELIFAMSKTSPYI